MKFLNLPWKWDTLDMDDPGLLCEVAIKRWHRGPVTFYRYTMRLLPDEKPLVYFSLCFMDNWSIALHAPFPKGWLAPVHGRRWNITNADAETKP